MRIPLSSASERQLLVSTISHEPVGDFHQIRMDITFGHDKELNIFGDLDLIFKVTASLKWPNLSHKVLV